MSHYYQHLTLNGPASVQAANIFSHVSHRLQLGAAAVVCKDPEAMRASLIRAWQRTIADVKQQRDLTVDTDMKLRLTQRLIKLQSIHIGTTMQHSIRIHTPVHLSAEGADVKSLYLAMNVTAQEITQLLTISSQCLVVGSLTPSTVRELELMPKQHLDHQAESAWRAITSFLKQHEIDLNLLIAPRAERLAHINASLEKLLDDTAAREFISRMNEFYLLARQAMPLHWSSRRTKEQQTLAVLASQVTTYTPGLTALSLADNEDPLFYLSDHRSLSFKTFWDSLFREDRIYANGPDMRVLAAAGLAG